MVGKPNLSVDQPGSAHCGAAMSSPGLTSALDQEREASMADEGGCAGAVMETQDAPVAAEHAARGRGAAAAVPPEGHPWRLLAGGFLAGLALGCWRAFGKRVDR